MIDGEIPGYTLAFGCLLDALVDGAKRIPLVTSCAARADGASENVRCAPLFESAGVVITDHLVKLEWLGCAGGAISPTITRMCQKSDQSEYNSSTHAHGRLNDRLMADYFGIHSPPDS